MTRRTIDSSGKDEFKQTPNLAAFIRWEADCYNYPNQGLTGSEYMWGGIADYSQPYPCPNGLGVIDTVPSESEACRRRIERARKDAAEFDAEFKMKAALAKRAAEAVDIEATVTISVATVAPVECFGRAVVEFDEQLKRFKDATA